MPGRSVETKREIRGKDQALGSSRLVVINPLCNRPTQNSTTLTALKPLWASRATWR